MTIITQEIHVSIYAKRKSKVRPDDGIAMFDIFDHQIVKLLAGHNLPTLADYLALTGGVPVYLLQLPPNHMNRDEFIVLTEQLTKEVQAARQRVLQLEQACKDNESDMDVEQLNSALVDLNRSVKAEWEHACHVHAINASKFRSDVGTLLEIRCKL